MPEPLGYQFDRKLANPIETYRQVNTITQRNAIPMGIRWEGMLVYVVSESQTYELNGGIENSNWIESGQTTTNPTTHFKGFFDATDLSPSLNNANGIEGDEYKVKNGGVNVNFGSGNVFLETDDIIIFYQSEWMVKVRNSDITAQSYTYTAPNNTFVTDRPITAILDIQIEHGCNFDSYATVANGNEVTIDDSIIFGGETIKIIYK